MAELAKKFPDGITYSIPYDTTLFVNISIEEVIHTFFEAVVLVILVVYLFLQNWRATLIPILAVPVSIIGAFAGMYVLGFSINLLTLFGLILAIGIVVDDAIIVLENVERLMTEEKLSPKEAAFKAMKRSFRSGCRGGFGTVIGVFANRVFGRHDRYDVPPVCRNHRHIGSDFRFCGLVADTGALCAADKENRRQKGTSGFLPGV